MLFKMFDMSLGSGIFWSVVLFLVWEKSVVAFLKKRREKKIEFFLNPLSYRPSIYYWRRGLSARLNLGICGKKCFWIVAFFFFSLVSLKAFAQPIASSGYWIQGVGGDSCASLVGEEDAYPPGKGAQVTYPNGQLYESKNFVYSSWIQGFLTAVGLESNNAAFSRQLGSPDFAGVELWIDNWCHANPDQTVLMAASAFVQYKRAGQ